MIQRNNPQITVFFNDETATTFYIIEDNKIYWGQLFEVECPSLVIGTMRLEEKIDK